MPNYILPLGITCGETTCASEPGTFCVYLYAEKFGSNPFCYLFSKQDNYKGRHLALEEKDGWLQRHPAYLAMAKENPNREVAAKEEPYEWLQHHPYLKALAEGATDGKEGGKEEA
jgi:hypothetical protein